jgi:dTDP-4-amino-4,6-dideoxygalactose transaminase
VIGGRCPDAELITRARAALSWWESRGEEPTSSVIGTGAVGELERTAALLAGRRHGLALPSATLALRVAMQAAGVGPGHEVLLPAYDWTASAAAVRSLGAIPVGVDIAMGAPLEGDCPATVDPTIDPAEVGRLVGPRTKAIVLTHLLGVLADVQALAMLARDAGIVLIEDAAQAAGGVLGAPDRIAADLTVLSLGPGKVLDAGEGGLLLADDPKLHRQGLRASQHPLRQRRHGLEADPQALVTRMHPLAAIIGLHQLAAFPAELGRLRAQQEEVDRCLAAVDGLKITVRPLRAQPGIPVLLPRGRFEVDSSPGLRVRPVGLRVLGPPSTMLPRRVPRATAASERLVVLR